MDHELEPRIYWAKQGGAGHFHFDVKSKEEQKNAAGHSRIRCPKCQWIPHSHDRWMCHCHHVWNTFDTRGKCPGCAFQWTQTMCLACLKFSEHEAWYETENRSK
jgi:hypothetical protein